MQLQVGKRYVTRDGRVTSPLVMSKAYNKDKYPFGGIVEGEMTCEDTGDSDTWGPNGEWFLEGNTLQPMELDLVAEAEEPTITQAMSVLTEVALERSKQDAKWGQENHSPTGWMPILGEEFGEVCLAVNEYNAGKSDTTRDYQLECYRKELIHVAAVAVAMVECLDRNKGVNK